MASTVSPAARLRATRASAGVKSNEDCTRGQDERGGAAQENVAGGQANGNDISRNQNRWRDNAKSTRDSGSRVGRSEYVFGFLLV